MGNFSSICKEVGARIRYFRKMRGYTLNDFAVLLNRSRAVLSKYERGEISVDLATLSQISNALNVPLYMLVDNAFQDDKSFVLPQTNVTEQEERQMQKAYIYTYFSHTKQPILRVHVLHYHQRRAVLYIFPTEREDAAAFEYYYSGQVVKGPSFTRFLFSNPLVDDDLFFLEFPTRFRLSSPMMGFFCSLSIGPFFPVAGAALFSDGAINDKDWLISRLKYAKEDMKANKQLNCFFISPDKDHYLYQEIEIHKKQGISQHLEKLS